MEITKNIISAFPVAPIAIDFKERKKSWEIDYVVQKRERCQIWCHSL